MTAPMDLPLFGKVKLYETSKSELLGLWQTVFEKNKITVQENSKVDSISSGEEMFKVVTLKGEEYTAHRILLAIGRRGTPRKLNIPGEMKEKVAYRLLEPEDISGKHIIVVGGGDSAVESALLLSEQNNVILSYRNEVFNRIKPLNSMALNKAVAAGKLEVMLNTNLLSIEDEYIILGIGKDGETLKLRNDLVYIFAGGELPTQFLEKAGILITKKFGETVMKH
jgi:thioredoxin reductase